MVSLIFFLNLGFLNDERTILTALFKCQIISFCVHCFMVKVLSVKSLNNFRIGHYFMNTHSFTFRFNESFLKMECSLCI